MCYNVLHSFVQHRTLDPCFVEGGGGENTNNIIPKMLSAETEKNEIRGIISVLRGLWICCRGDHCIVVPAGNPINNIAQNVIYTTIHNHSSNQH